MQQNSSSANAGNSKIRFHVKALATQLEVNQYQKKNVSTIVTNLTMMFPEYKRMPKDMLWTSVDEAFQDLCENELKDSSNKNNNNNNNNTTTTNKNANNDRNASRPPIEKRKRRKLEISNNSDNNNNNNNNNNSHSNNPSSSSNNMHQVSRPVDRLKDLAGITSVLKQIEEQVFYPVYYHALYQELGISAPTGLMLHGPSGCGKTHLALAIAGELNLNFFRITGPEIIGGTSGESEGKVRDIFKSAIDNAPSILFIDAFEVIAFKRDSSQRGMDRRVVAQLCDCIDSVATHNNSCKNKNISSMTGMNMDSTTSSISSAEAQVSQSQSCAVSMESEEVATSNETVRDDSISSNTKEDATVATSNTTTTFTTDDNDDQSNKGVIVIAATSRPDSLDPGVRGRFAKEIALPVPDASARSAILKLMTCDMKLENEVDFVDLGRRTPGYVGADLKVLANEAGAVAVRRIVGTAAIAASSSSSDTLSTMHQLPVGALNLGYATVTMPDFLTATKAIQPTAKREGFAVVPDVSWDDVGALVEVREELLHNVLEPIAKPEQFSRLGLDVPAGVLFFGPPGCGKTLLAKALANHSGANFISVKGPELLNMYVGESESRVRQVFTRARASAPCVIFFDELDALCPKRGRGSEGGNGVSERVVNQLLTELDGLEVRKDVYVIAATNRLELIDDAMLRPGRLGKLLYVPLPSENDRVSILQALTRSVALNRDDRIEGIPDLENIAKDPRIDGYSGADLANLVREAGMAVMKEMRARDDNNSDNKCSVICKRHFETAIERTRPSVNKSDRKRYDNVQKHLKDGMGAIEALAAAELE